MTRGMPWILAVALLVAGCLPRETRELHRCQADLDLKDLMEAVGVPPQPGGWGVSGQTLGLPQQPVFDREFQTALLLPDPEGFVLALCGELRSHLEQRCTVEAFLAEGRHCQAETASRSADTTDEKGYHFRLSSRGRVNLHAYPHEAGATYLVLAATEW